MYLGRFANSDEADCRAMVDVNLMGLLTVTQAALVPMLALGPGDIVNVSSVSRRAAAALFSVYSATKFAVHGFTEALRQELADTGIRVLTVEPGAAQTEIGQHLRDPDVASFFGNATAGVTILSPEEVAQVLVFALPASRSRDQ